MSEEEQIVEQEGRPPEVNETESRARHMGWAPKEEFRGDPEKWVDAETFVKRGENIMPMLKERNRALETKVAEMERVLVEMREWASKSEQRSYEKALSEVKAKRKEAFTNGDADAFERAETEMEQLQTQRQPQKPVSQPVTDTEFDQWRSENTWIDADPELRSYAMSIGNHIAQTKPHLTKRAYLDEIKALTAKQFPEKFGNTKRNGAPTVESTAAPVSKKKEKTFNDLPADAKSQCQRFERTIPGFTKEQYLKDFDWSGYEKQRA